MKLTVLSIEDTLCDFFSTLHVYTDHIQDAGQNMIVWRMQLWLSEPGVAWAAAPLIGTAVPA
jgi:hypothetical protein